MSSITSLTTTTTSNTYITASGVSAPFTFNWTEPIRFGFEIKFKTTKAKLDVDWKIGDLILGTLAVNSELKKLL